MKRILFGFVALIQFSLGFGQSNREVADSPAVPGNLNPFLPGYFADPSILKADDTYYIYATTDGYSWNAGPLTVWQSRDFVNWTNTRLNWPVGDKIWAPSVVKAKNGKFYMYVSVNENIYVGVADSPAGPWKNAKPDGTAYITKEKYPLNVAIDAEGFIDEDGQPYLYWGNGRCYVVKLKPDMVTFDGEPKDITPEHYTEGPYIVNHKGTYYLTYSQGHCSYAEYKVRYAVADNPFGPFKEAGNSPILVTNADSTIHGPGHHSVLKEKDAYYIVYHRHDNPHHPDGIHRQVCIDRLELGKGKTLEKVKTTHTGINPVNKASRKNNLAFGKKVTTSSQGDNFDGAYAVDENLGTRWAAKDNRKPQWLKVDLGAVSAVRSVEPVFEYLTKYSSCTVECSTDDKNWQTFAENIDNADTGFPLVYQGDVKARYLRITITGTENEADKASLWELKVF